MTEGQVWSGSQVEDAKDLVTALMEDPASGIMSILPRRAQQVDVGLLPEMFDHTRELVIETLAAAGLGGIANFTVSTGLSFG